MIEGAVHVTVPGHAGFCHHLTRFRRLLCLLLVSRMLSEKYFLHGYFQGIYGNIFWLKPCVSLRLFFKGNLNQVFPEGRF